MQAFSTINQTDLQTSGNQLAVGLGAFQFAPSNNTPATPQVPAPAGIGVQYNQSLSLFDTSFSLLVWSFNGSATIGILFGAFHGIALGLSLNGQVNLLENPPTATLTCTADAGTGGLYCGATAQFDINLAATEASLQWVSDGWDSGFETVYNSIMNVDFTTQVDLLDLILLFLQDTTGNTKDFLEALTNVDHDATFLGVYGFYGTESNGLAGGGELTVTPTMDLDIDVLTYIPSLGEILTGLEHVGLSLAAGPSLGLEIPTTFSIYQLTTDDGAIYGNPTVSGATTTLTQTNAGSVTPATTINTITVELSHVINFDITLDAFVSLSFLDIFSLSASFPLVTFADVLPQKGPFYSQFPATANGSTIPGGIGQTPNSV